MEGLIYLRQEHKLKNISRPVYLLVHLCLLLLYLAGCATTIPVEERAQKRQEIKQAAADTIAELIEKESGLQAKVDASLGYFVAQISAVSATVIGGGSGVGVLYDKEDSTRTYMNVRRYDLGMGLGVRNFRMLILFNDREGLEDFRNGGWETAAGAEVAGGDSGAASAGLSRAAQFDFSIHFLTDSGAHAAASIRLLTVSTNHDLTHTGLSDISIPGRGFTAADAAPEDAPREWNRALPFYAQKVIDKGYNLPLPYGVGLTYAYVDQEQLLDELEIGFGGSEKTPIQFVSFDNASSISQSGQLKLDAWLFPFMNVFALLGKVDGKAPLEFTIDGDDALAQLGTDCSGTGPLRPPICGALEGRAVTVPIEASFRGNTYGIGTVLAGGWNNYFVTIPLTFTYADMEDSDTEGLVYTTSPRFGYVFSLGNAGNLAAYLGASYINSDLTVSGTVTIPDTNVNVDYKIAQSNKDNWNALFGLNYDINRRWSVSAEYQGFAGSRESGIASLGYRF